MAALGAVMPKTGGAPQGLPGAEPGAHTGDMSAEPISTAVDTHDEGNVQCWCCDVSDAPERMVQLGNHPEVHLCLRCAHFVHQQAWEIEDEGTRGPGAFARDRLRNLRAEVMRRGWHQSRFIGDGLRWLGKYLP
jgi:hypothetical protein